MKRALTFFAATILILSFAACGNAETNKPTESSNDKANVTTTQNNEQTVPSTAAITETPTTEAADDSTLIEAAKKQLTGSWNYPGVDEELLTFNEDGTGTYTGIGGKDYSFSYNVSVIRDTYNNGTEYTNNLMSVTYNTGETEYITFEFRKDAEEKMIFHNSDYSSGYSGIITFDEWTKD
ncbi:MAG: hypothetical protein U0L58_01470 [Ruminococcus sp.]|nr:hypothetical protein [Ruminococcus sp.]